MNNFNDNNIKTHSSVSFSNNSIGVSNDSFSTSFKKNDYGKYSASKVERTEYSTDGDIDVIDYNDVAENDSIKVNKDSVREKYFNMWINNVGLSLVSAAVSYKTLGYTTQHPIAQFLLKGGADSAYTVYDSGASIKEFLDLEKIQISNFKTNPIEQSISSFEGLFLNSNVYQDNDLKYELTKATRSTAAWGTILYGQSILKFATHGKINRALIQGLPDSPFNGTLIFKNVKTGERYIYIENVNARVSNSILTLAVTATIDFSNTLLDGERDAIMNGEVRYYKQYMKAKFINDLDENLCDIIGATIMDFFLPGAGSWLGGPILSGIYETSYEVTEYLLEINGKPVPPRPMSGYDDFMRKRAAISVLHTSAREIYDAKCQVYPADSIERKSAKVQYNVDDIGYGSWQAVCFLAKSCCNDPEINSIKYSKDGESDKFGFPEDGLNSYGFVEWVIHNAGFKINNDILNSLDKYKINVYQDFSVLQHKGTISLGDILYRDVNGNGEIDKSDRCYIVSKVTDNSISLVRQWSYGTDEKTYIFNKIEDYENFLRDTNISGFIDMDDYYDDIDKNVDYSREDIQETINMIKEMENNGD